MKSGDIVRWINPQNDSEATERYHVLWIDGDAVCCEITDADYTLFQDWTIRPIMTFRASELMVVS